jgi:serine/threonine protein kinase
MDHNKEQGEIPNGDEWLKTISDGPVSNIGSTAGASVQSAYIIPEMPDGKNGVKLGSGTITGFLGEGGMARVYKTWDEDLEIHRAVKVLLPTSKKEFADRFITEAKITARLDHPNIVKVFRVGKWNDYPFMEMEFIDGMSLEAMLEKRGSFPAYAVYAVGIFIARALQYAHILDYTLLGKRFRGLIHRDLKPANIMLRNNGRLKLMDFGIARPLSTGLHNTIAGNIVGTLPYLSPEQLNGEPVDHRTDIYAVGAILYELLCGIKAFPDERLTELFTRKTSGVYMPFGEIPVTVPKKLTEIVDRCLQVKKEDRYPDADTLHEALNTAYNQYADELPEKALKKYASHPDYMPLLTTSGKKRKNNVRWFRMPHLRFPFPSPRLPRFRLPEFSMPRLPGKQIVQLVKSIGRGVEGVSSAVSGFIMDTGKASLRILKTAGMLFTRIPKIAYGISGGIILVGLLAFYISQHKIGHIDENPATSDKPANSSAVTSVVDTVQPVVTVGRPEIVSPGNDETLRAETLKVVWTQITSADSYRVHFSCSGDFSDTVLLQAVPSDTSLAITGLEPGIYYCRVGTADKEGCISWGTSGSFNLAADIPELLTPLDGNAYNIGKITFQWENVLDAGSYRFMLSGDSTFEDTIFDSSGCTDTSITMVFQDFAGMTYFWRVRLEQEQEEECWSNVHSFSVEDFCSSALSALSKKKLVSMEKAIKKIPSTNPRKDVLTIRLAESYVETGNMNKAEAILNSTDLRDVLVDCLRSRILFKRKKYAAAMRLLDASTYSKTLFTSWQDSANVLYWRAVVTQKVYDIEKNKKIGRKAYHAWESVKRQYQSKPEHSRFYNASKNMYSLFYSENVFERPADSLKQLRK